LKRHVARSCVVPTCVAPRRGAWIETYEMLEELGIATGRTPQGCVD